MASTPLSEITFVVLDLETTGASPSTGSAITEIGAIAVRGGAIIGEFETFVNPLASIPPYITELTGITDQMLATAPIIDEALPAFLEFLSNLPIQESIHIVAHNAPFDLGFLRAAAVELELEWPTYGVLDTVRLARSVIERSEILNYKLGTLSHFFQTKDLPTHRAIDDVKTTIEVLHRLIERLAGFEIYTMQELTKFVGKRRKL